MVTAIVIPVEMELPLRQQELDPHDVGTYRQIIGGPIELVLLDRPSASLYFHGEGKLEGLPINTRATALLWVHNSALRGQDVIVGPALILGPVDRRGDDETVPEDLVDLLLHTKRFRFQVKVRGEVAWAGNDVVYGSWLDAYLDGIQLAQRWTQVEDIRVVPELDDDLREAWFRAGQTNRWIRAANDPPFTRDSFVGCYSIEELAERLAAGMWCVGTAFYYRDLCLIQQVDGGDEWLTIRHRVPFESLTVGPLIEAGRFTELVRRFLAASKEECEGLGY